MALFYSLLLFYAEEEAEEISPRDRIRFSLILYAQALQSGALITLLILSVFLAVLYFDFDALFTQFHTLFFTPGTWFFDEKSTLIKLYPEGFWHDAGIAVGILSAFFAGLLYLLCSFVLRSSESLKQY